MAGIYLSEAPIYLSEAQYSTHCIVYTYTVYCTYSHRKGGGRDKPERRLEEPQFTKLDRKYQHLQSINSDKHLPQSSFTGNFLDDNILLGFGVYCLCS